MQTSDIGRNVLIAREGLRTKAYKDSVGVLTIGVGHTSAAGEPKVTPGLTITIAEAQRIFAKDLVKYERAVKTAVKGGLAQHEFDALVSLCYNIGPGAFAKSTLVKRINTGAVGDALDEAFMRFKIPAEIIPRRRAEADQFAIAYDVAMPKARSTDRGRISAKRRHVAQDAGAPAKPIPVLPLPIVPDAGAHPVTFAQQDPDLVAPTKPLTGLWSLLQGKPPVPKGERGEVVAGAKEEAPSIMRDLGALRALGLVGAGGSALGGLQDSGILDSIKSSADGATSTFESVQTLINLILGAVKWGVQHWWVFGIALAVWMLIKVGWAVFKLYVYAKSGSKPNGD